LDNVARCCGSAGVAEFFLDLHRYLAGDPWTVDWRHALAWMG
jgi:hypothetical protein